jgi:hypothetical protein
VRMRLRWTRGLYEFYAAGRERGDEEPHAHASQSSPIILDADDFITSTVPSSASQNPVLQKPCTLTGLSADKLRSTWHAATADELEELGSDAMRRFFDTLRASTGIVGGRLQGLVTQLDVQV